MRIVQITDTHLSLIKPHFNRNWEPLVAWIDEQKPDLIVHTGDLTVDCADVEADFLFCQACLDDLPARVLSLPGNHDIGHLPGSRQPVNPQRLTRCAGISARTAGLKTSATGASSASTVSSSVPVKLKKPNSFNGWKTN